MLRSKFSLAVLSIWAVTDGALAAGNREASPSSATDTAIAFLPFAILLLLLYIFFRRQTKSPLAKLQQQYMDDNIQHMKRVEASLERIAKALEERNGK
ncbi:hypothetical protein BH09VER1_BH09VER1_41430 [soil metagenome]